ncbi:Smg-4/UPF3 family-domain-containing protein [Multifurca ochricompacta]|uniref:Smg-4/UPF3 family-domain-containing protein n=1 Tax=Multifurca ochricompacta TaxID=376703 RepID=A0AAD4M222_9AGAM|nr:Smg-4/UPF3 family-domain-containing protein [Multifurca ochricompacta]
MSGATSEPPKKLQAKPKVKEKRQGQTKVSGTERLKIIVRRLPPNLPESIFWQSVQTWVTDETALWKEFYPGKLRKRLNKENVHSRAYIAFKTEEFVAKFSREYDGHVFRDKTAVVEFAPNQKLPLEKKKADSRNATINQDEEYIAFLQSLETPSTKPYDADQLLEMLVASTERPTMPASTPLLNALKAEKSAQRDKEAIQRNHPHYKEVVQASKKEEFKKKSATAVTNAASAGKGDLAAPLGKRAAKRAAAAQKATAQSSALAPPKAGSAPAGPSAAKPPPPSPSKAKSARAGKQLGSAPTQSQEAQPPKPSSTPSNQVQVAPVLPSNSPTEVGASAPAPSASNASGRRSRPVLGVASRQFEVALSGAGVSKGGGRRDRGTEKEKEKEKEKEPTKDGPVRERRDVGSRRKREEDVSGRNPAPTQPGVLPAPTILQREAGKLPHLRPSQQAPAAEVASGAVAPSDAGAGIALAGRGSGKRGRGRSRGGNREAPAPPADP